MTQLDTATDPVRSLSAIIDRLARTPELLIASDYDGTLSQIVDNPADAVADRDALVALRALAEMPRTHAAIVSGRSLRDLARLSDEPRNVHLVGSHGSEFDLDFAQRLTGSQRKLMDRITRELTEIAGGHAGLAVETKPASVALHYRNAPEDVGQDAARRVLDGPAGLPGVHVKRGKMVLELAVVSTSKGTALQTLRHRLGTSTVLFVGDDVTDEDAFATLGGPDVGIKVGEGDTLAEYRVDSVRDVARLLACVAEARSEYLRGAQAEAIQDHAMLSDMRTIALSTSDARITWLCLPRIDSSAVFAEILGGPAAGHFSITPVDARSPSQRYVGDSLSVRTAWKDLSVTDYLDCSGNRAFQRPGRSDLVRVIEGTAKTRIEFAPRLDFGRQPTRLAVVEDGLKVLDTPDPIVLRSPGITWTVEQHGSHDTATAEIEPNGGPVVLELRFGTGSAKASVLPESQRRRQTERFWEDWSSRLTLPDLEPDLVRRSALTLRALCFGPTGAIAAAGTTSLPEQIGGVRNWDYRYCWPRDASMTASALAELGSTLEAMRLLDWLMAVIDTLPSPDRLQPIYTVMGTELGPEGEIAELPGYAGSRPVRVGNAASRQLQLDVFGPIIDLVHTLLKLGAPVSGEHWKLVEAAVKAVEARWDEPDHGIWEIRGEARHHVHSKVMCWVTIDRAISIADQLLGEERPAWVELRDRIADDVLTKGWNESAQAFTTAYGYDAPDAACLEIGLRGLLPADDERFAATIRAVEAQLREGDTVFRYHCDDGLPGAEGGFNLCTAWLIESMAMTGRRDDARRLFGSYCKLAGPTGLIPEEVDPATGAGLGNHPQAYSHLGLINCALRLAR